MPLPVELIIPAFLAGILMFLAPCTLPLVPAYLGAIAGVRSKKMGEKAGWKERMEVLRNAVLFVLGFSILFILFGTAVGWGGQFLFAWRRFLEYIAGLFIIVFGLSLIGLFRIPVFRAAKSLRLTAWTSSRALNSLLLGMAFGVGWTPCVGPIVGSILLIATVSGNTLGGALLLGVFSMGLAVPFLLTALACDSISPFILRIARRGRIIDLVSGALLVGFGVLIVSGNYALIIVWGYKLLRFINYERILDFL